MHIIIPMSGIGKRFIDAGYQDPKPLIEIDGKPIIEHVVNLFPGESKFTFLCNSTHLAQTNMREELVRIAPTGQIVEIPNHKKGPVFAVKGAYDLIDDDEEVIVNYCDFSTYWDYEDFLNHTRTRGADGAIPAYKGFHPHMMGSTNYAFMRDEMQWMQEIKEKEPFTNNRTQEYASNGTYYFRTGEILKRCFDLTMKRDLNLKGEYYVSLVYNILIEQGLKVSIYEIQHMLQWGTPADVEEYKQWSGYFKDILSTSQLPIDLDCKLNIVVPMAGEGSRFVKEGYKTPKPLIDVSGKHMVTQAIESLPKGETHIFVCRKGHLEQSNLRQILTEQFEKSKVVEIDYLTEGQACTTELAVNEIENTNPIIVGPCDNGMLWNKEKFQKVLLEEPDVIVWSFKNYAGANLNPQMYGWSVTDSDDNIKKVSVKKAISDSPNKDHGVVGTFYFRNRTVFQECLKYLYDNDIRVNDEFYVDSMVGAAVDLGLKVKSFVIDHYLCWGTPNDYKTFNYWQSFFDKCDWHPYQIERDPTVADNRIDAMKREFRKFGQEFR